MWQITGLDLEEFKLKRRYNSVSEFKDLTASLRDSTIHDNGSIHIELGAPLQKDEHIMKYDFLQVQERKFRRLLTRQVLPLLPRRAGYNPACLRAPCV